MPVSVAWVTPIRSQFKNSDDSLREAEAKFKQGKFAEAEPLFLLGLVLLERNLPEDHPEVLACMEKLGDTFYASEKFKDAQPVYRRLVGIRENGTAPVQLTVSAMFKLAKTHEKLSQPDEAEENYKRAMKLGEPMSGPLFANLCDAFALFLKKTNRDVGEATRLAELARKRRAADAANAAQTSEDFGSTTLQVAAVRQKDSGNGLMLSNAGTQAEAANTGTDDVEAEPQRELEESVTVVEEEIVTEGSAEPVEDVAESAPEIEQESDTKVAPGAVEAFDASVLDAIKAPGVTSEAQAVIDKAALDAIKAPGKPAAAKPTLGGSAFNKEKLEAFRAAGGSTTGPHKAVDIPAPTSTTAPAAKSDAGASAYKIQDLNSIGSPKSSGEKLEKSALDAIQLPGAGGGTPPTPVPEVDPAAKQRKAMSATRTSAAVAAPGPAMNPAQYFVPGIILLILVSFGLVLTYFYMNSNSPNGPSNPALLGYVDKAYVSPDLKQKVSVASATKGNIALAANTKKPDNVAISLKQYTGNPLEELQAVAGNYDKAIWLQADSRGLKASDGAIFYTSDSPDLKLITEMWNLADSAQIYYRKFGRYPRQTIKDPPILRDLNSKYSWDNPYNDKSKPPEIILYHASDKDAPSSPMGKTGVEDAWLSGRPLSATMTQPGTIRCVQIGFPELGPAYVFDPYKYTTQNIDDFFIEGFNKYNELIRGADGNVFMIILRRGQDTTPVAAQPLVPQGTKGPVTVVISDSERPNKTGIIIKYTVSIVVLVLFIVITSNWTRIRKFLRREQ